jgi:hypothetical protein
MAAILVRFLKYLEYQCGQLEIAMLWFQFGQDDLKDFASTMFGTHTNQLRDTLIRQREARLEKRDNINETICRSAQLLNCLN